MCFNDLVSSKLFGLKFHLYNLHSRFKALLTILKHSSFFFHVSELCKCCSFFKTDILSFILVWMHSPKSPLKASLLGSHSILYTSNLTTIVIGLFPCHYRLFNFEHMVKIHIYTIKDCRINI